MSLVVVSLVLPVVVVPLVCVLFFPEVSVVSAVLCGVVFSLFVAIVLRFIQGVKAFGARLFIAVIVIAVLAGLLLGLLPKLLPC